MSDLYVGLARDNSLKAQLLEWFPELAEDHAALIDTLDGLSDLDEQIAVTMRQVIERESFAVALDSLIGDMMHRATRLREGAGRMRSAVLHVMQESGRKRVVKPDMTIIAQAGRPGYVVTDADQVPDDLCKIYRKPRLKDIAAAVAGGRDVPGIAAKNGNPFITVHRK